ASNPASVPQITDLNRGRGARDTSSGLPYSTTTSLTCDAFKKRQDGIGDFAAMCFKCKVPSVIKMHLALGDIPFERFRAGRKKERIIFAPDRQQWRLVFAEIFLKRRVQCDVVRVILEQIELDFVGIGTGQIKIVQRTAIWRNDGWIGNAIRVLESSGFRLEEYTECVAICLRCILPVGANWIPAA